jgi:tetratricopeptide (TPR) repeat protein
MSSSSVNDSEARAALLGQVLDDYAERLGRGEQPCVEEYARRYPQFAAVLRLTLPALEAVRPGVGETATDEAPAARGCLGDFRIVREVGRGGMGIVYEAEQLSLKRRVALKVLPLAPALGPRQLARFQNEAQAAAQLHHTNIVPVYAVGCERGVHYYAMQLIDGQTLAQLICTLRQQAGLEPPPGPAPAAGPPGQPAPEPSAPAQGGADLPLTAPYAPGHGAPPAGAAETAGAGVAALSTERSARGPAFYRAVARLGAQAAEALEHAHQLGVVHRDVKPGNLMLDGRGNLWVTDFGLAQVQSDSRLTMSGDLVGTLRYMSPEQALGQRGGIDPRSDVYALGATLYELLTLRPVFEGRDRAELLRQIAFDEPRPLRRVDRAIPPELDIIVLKALAKGPAERYGTAQEVADDLERFLKDEPIRAKRPSLVQRLRKWSRRHKPVVAASATILLALLMLSVGAGLWYQRQWAERERDAAAALAQAETFLDEGGNQRSNPAHWQARALLAQGAVKRAQGLLAAGRSSEKLAEQARQLRERADTEVADSTMLGKLERIRLAKSEVSKDRFTLVQSGPSYAQAFQDYGVDLAAPAPSAARVQNSRLRDALLAALCDWRRSSRDKAERKQLGSLLAALEPGASGLAARWLAALRRQDRAALLELARDEGQRLPAATIQTVASELLRLKERAAAERLLRAGQERFPGDFGLNYDLGLLLRRPGPTRAEAVGCLRAALALRSDNPVVYAQLGAALMETGDLEGAIRCHRAALGIDPHLALAHGGLGEALRAKGAVKEALAAYRECLGVLREVLRRKPDNFDALFNLALTSSRTGAVDESIAAYKKAIRVRPDSSNAYCNLGNQLWAKGALDEAVAACEKAIRLEPEDAFAHNNLGNALLAKGAVGAAIASYQEAIRLEPDHGLPHNNLGNALWAKGAVGAAIASYQEAIRRDPGLAMAHHNLGNALMEKGAVEAAIAAYQEATRLEPDDFWAHCNLAEALLAKGALEKAIVVCKKALRLKPGQSRSQHTRLTYVYVPQEKGAVRRKRDDAQVHDVLGWALLKTGRIDEAMTSFKEVARLRPGEARAHSNLGVALAAKGAPDQALAAYKKAIHLKPDFFEAHYNRGLALANKGKIEEAIVAFKEAIRHNPGFVEAYTNLGNALWIKGAWEEAIAACKEAIYLRPDSALTHNNLGNALRSKGAPDQALAAYQEAIRLRPDFFDAHYNLGLLLASKGATTEAIACYEEAIRLRPDSADASYNLGYALQQQGQFPAALDVLRRFHQRGTRHPGSAKWVKDAERLVTLDKKLPEVLREGARPADAAERIELARLCQMPCKRLHAAAARFYAEAFVAERKLAEDLRVAHRYNAACAAALAGCGQGKDAGKLDGKERARLRSQALDWLRTDLQAWQRLLEKGPDRARPVVVQKMRDWLADPDFGGVRGAALGKLPEAERPGWDQLWREVEDLRRQAGGPRSK